ncbi:MAG: hypothetical protein JXR20_02865 [Balneola sp.]
MKSIIYISLAWLLLVILPNCTLDRVNGSSSDVITDAYLETATLILGESISGNNSGVYLSVQDALSIISQSGFTPKRIPKAKTKFKYDQISNLRTRYDQDTGVHTVTFERSAQNTFKTESDSLLYIYTDQQGDFIAFPREQQDLIETISYQGFKEGSINSGPRISTFERRNEFLISNVSDDTNPLPLQGVHVGTGLNRIESADGDAEQNYYELVFNFLNIEIERSFGDQNQIQDFNLVGGLSWELNLWDSPEKIISPISISGTMSFTGDGNVLVRFNGIDGVTNIDVETGQEIPVN